jgi:hypothetical protein
MKSKKELQLLTLGYRKVAERLGETLTAIGRGKREEGSNDTTFSCTLINIEEVLYRHIATANPKGFFCKASMNPGTGCERLWLETPLGCTIRSYATTRCAKNTVFDYDRNPTMDELDEMQTIVYKYFRNLINYIPQDVLGVSDDKVADAYAEEAQTFRYHVNIQGIIVRFKVSVGDFVGNMVLFIAEVTIPEILKRIEDDDEIMRCIDESEDSVAHTCEIVPAWVTRVGIPVALTIVTEKVQRYTIKQLQNLKKTGKLDLADDALYTNTGNSKVRIMVEDMVIADGIIERGGTMVKITDLYVRDEVDFAT